MRKLLALFCFLSCFGAFGQSATQIRDSIAAKLPNRDYRTQGLKAADIRNVLNDIANYADTKIPNTTSTALRLGLVGTPDAVILTDKQGGVFRYNSANTTSADDSAMVIRIGSRRYERVTNVVTPDFFGANRFDNLDDTEAVNKAKTYLKNKGGGTMLFLEGTYYCNLVMEGGDHISLEGKGNRAMIRSWLVNKFAIMYDQGFPENGVSVKNLTFDGRDASAANAKKRHGLYINIGSAMLCENVTFQHCGIGMAKNSTIDCTFDRCSFIQSYVGAFITTTTGAENNITEIDGQTVVLTDYFFESHPTEDAFVACFFNVNDVHMFVDQPSLVNYGIVNNIKFYGGLMQAAKVGVYLNGGAELLSMPMSFDNVWWENTVLDTSLTVPVNGFDLIPGNLYTNGGMVTLRNMFVDNVKAVGNSLVKIYDSSIGYGYFKTEGVASIEAENVIGDDIFVPLLVNTGMNFREGRTFRFYTGHKTEPTRQFRDKVKFSSRYALGDALPGAWGGATITRDSTGGLFTDPGCVQVVADATHGFYTPTEYGVTLNKVYVQILGLKSMGSSFQAFCGPYDGGGNTGAGAITVTPKWQTFAVVGRGTGTNNNRPLITVSAGQSTQTFKVSGHQVLEFDSIGEAYQFLRSNSFAL